MLDLNGKFEIVITCYKEKYKAICPAFPACKGFGSTENEAIKKLSKSISKYVSSITEETLKSVLLSSAYTEILLDKSKESKEQRRIFNLETSIKNTKKELPNFNLSKPKQNYPQKNSVRDINDFFKKQEIDFLDVDEHFSAIEESVINNSQDGFVFGFLVSLN